MMRKRMKKQRKQDAPEAKVAILGRHMLEGYRRLTFMMLDADIVVTDSSITLGKADRPQSSSPGDLADPLDHSSTPPMAHRSGGTRSQQPTPRLWRRRPGVDRTVRSESSPQQARQVAFRPKLHLGRRLRSSRRYAL